MEARHLLSRHLKTSNTPRRDFAARIGYSLGMLCEVIRGNRRPRPEKALIIEQETGGAVPWADWYHPAASKPCSPKRQLKTYTKTKKRLPRNAPTPKRPGI